MTDENKILQLLTEMRDLSIVNTNKYDEHLKTTERAYTDHIFSAVKQNIILRAIHWVAMFVVIYAAVYLAIQSAK